MSIFGNYYQKEVEIMTKFFGLLLALSFSSNICFAALGHSHAGLKVKYAYGQFETKGCEKVDVADGYPIPHAGCDFPDDIQKTTKLKAVAGANFGVLYQIEGLEKDKCYTVTHHLSHPMMTLPDGSQRDVYQRHFKIGSCVRDSYRYMGFFSWELEEPWEAEKGEWVFKIRVDGNTLIEQPFLLESSEPEQ